MESLHILAQRVVNAGMFRGISMGLSLQLSHLFYADDVVFMGHWSDSNIDIIVQVLECFYRASGLRINMNKSKLIGISAAIVNVDQAAAKIGCATLKAPFSYLGLKVLQRMESIRCHFFNGVDHNGKKLIWVKWSKVLGFKEKGGFGVSSFNALSRALLFKWVWRFRTQRSSLRARFIKGIHGEDGKIGKNVKHSNPSIWLDIVRKMEQRKNHSMNLIDFIHKKMGNGADTSFWEDVWKGDAAFKSLYPRVYALETLASMEELLLVDIMDQ
ncbi:hypothetical protein Tco_0983637 [Tanacetum coccineum]